MLNRRTFIFIVSLAGTALAAAPAGALSATVDMAAPATPTSPPPKFPPGKAPLAPPVMDDVSQAYAFRTQLLGDPRCQRFATESDAVFLNGGSDSAARIARLQAIAAEAKASGCLASAAYY